MTLSLTVTEGVLPKGQDRVAFAKLSKLMLKWHGLTGNKAMAPNVVGSLHVARPQGHDIQRHAGHGRRLHRVEVAVVRVHGAQSELIALLEDPDDYGIELIECRPLTEP